MNKEVVKANIVVFIASFGTLVIELVAGRIMAPYVGVSLYTWTSIIGVVLAGISIGAYLGGLIADRYPRTSTLGWLLFLSGLGALVISPLTNLIGAARFQTTLMMRILILTSVIFFVPSCILGIISPVVVKLILSNLSKTGNIVGKIYAFSTLGSIIGTFATGFYLISWMGTRNILLTMAIILILSALVFGGAFNRKRSVLIVLAVLTPLVWTFYGYAFKPPLNEKIYHYFKESDYYTIKLSSYHTKDGQKANALILDNLIHSINVPDNPKHLDYEYLRIYDEFVTWRIRGSNSLQALFIGGGGYTYPRYLEMKNPSARIDVVEIDPEVTRVAYDYLGIPKDTRIRSFNEDGRWFVMNCQEKGKYDFIFGDAFNDLSIPYHLTTKEFAIQMAALLKPEGILMANLIDSYEKGLFLPSYIRTLEEVFGRGHVHLVAIAQNFKGIGTCVVVASRANLDLDDFVKNTRIGTGGKMTSTIIPQERLQEHLAKRPYYILTDDFVPVDNLVAPIFEERFGYKKNR